MLMKQRKFAAFDIDGTLIRWQLYHVIVDKLASAGLLGPDAKQRLRDARMIWKRREHPDAFKTYETALIAIYEEALPTMQPQALDDIVMTVIDEYKDQVYVFTRDLLQQLKREGYFLLIISGSNAEIIEKVSEYYRFDDWVGTTYHRDKNSFKGTKHVASFDKAQELKNLVAKHNLTYSGSVGIGDSASDAAMLALVEKPIAFNPDQRLFTEAQKHQWDIVIERKNVVYTLKADHGTYVLA